MALKKITLQLGSKTISLTVKQFEELKQDMRELDKQHHYYWNHSPWYGPWYSGIRSFTHPIIFDSSVGGSLSSSNTVAGKLDVIGGSTPLGVDNFTNTDRSVTQLLSDNSAAKPPAYSGSILSTG